VRLPRRLAALALGLWIAAAAEAKDLSWRAFDVTARLDAQGALHVVETQTFVFNGDWNGGERTFRLFAGQGLAFESITRVEPDGTRHPLTGGDLSKVDEYGFVGDDVLRWRSRLPFDPPFENAELVYEIAYTLSGILVKQGDRYVLDHDFAFPNRDYSIRKFTLTLELDPVWKPEKPLRERFETGVLPPGQGYVVNASLAYAGTGEPAAMNRLPIAQKPATSGVRKALLAAFGAAIVFLFLAFRSREKALGRYAPLTPPEQIDQRWLEANLLSLSAEEAGALWDAKIGSPEVAAVLARLEAEKKISTKADGKKLSMRLLVPLEKFQGYEHDLLKGFFFGGRKETDTDAIKSHYKSTGFDPASKIKPGLEAKVSAYPDFGDQSPAPSRGPTVFLFAAGVLALLAAIFVGNQDFGTVIGLAITLGILYGLAVIGAVVFRRLVDRLDASSILILWMPLLLFFFVWLGVREGNRAILLFVVGGLLVRLAMVRSIFNLAATRDGPKRIARRKALASARAYFKRELDSPAPRLQDSWFPYVVAFGLTSDADRWFKAHGAAAAASSGSSSTWTGSSSSTPSSSGGGSGGWTGGGGSFGGAGASGTWAVAAGALAAGVASPSSSSGGGGGGGGGGSSGGGGGGGW
jgi:uncharacterized membrane protein YgcG